MRAAILLFFWCCLANFLIAQPLSVEQLTSYPFPTELQTAATGGRMALAINEQGRRNLYAAEAPLFELRKLTAYNEDLGSELTGVRLSADGEWVVFVSGGDHGAFNESVPRNPASLPVKPKVEIWSVPFAGGAPVLLGEGDYPAISPRGNRVAFVQDGQVWVCPIDGSAKPRQLFYARGENGSLQWSPDGTRLAFVSARGDYSFIGVYHDDGRPIQWLAPAFARDDSPRWSPDGTRVAFVRRQAAGGAPDSLLAPLRNPWAIWTAAIAGGAAGKLWQSPDSPMGAVPTTHGGTNLHWVGKGRIVFVSYHDGWPHLYSVADTGGDALLLTPGNFMVEHITVSPDKQWLLASANTGPDDDDIDRRHLIGVPVDRPGVQVLTPGQGIETFPTLTGDGQHLTFLSATTTRPTLPAVLPWPVEDADFQLLGEDLVPEPLAKASLVVPRRVEFKAPDGKTVYGQLFEPEDNSELRKPAVLFIHGGPQRQMLLGWHYGDYYANTYALNQYLVSQGFVVLSVNYRLGIGYGYDFHKPLFAGSYGASEYQDIKAAGEWLAGQPQVDARRIGVYGGSYGGFLTALALGRDSDLFAAGVDIHGVHSFIGRVPLVSADPAPDLERAVTLARQSSPVSYVDTWRSPVLLIHGDDDGNVDFEQSVDLVRRLEQGRVPHETLVIPDETHHWMLYRHQVQVYKAIADFLVKHLGVAGE